MPHPLTDTTAIAEPIEPYLARIGDLFRAFRDHDSGCVSYGVQVNERRWFIKHSDQAFAIPWLRQAITLNRRVQHRAMPRLHNAFETPGGLALVYDWVLGELLYFSSRVMDQPDLDPMLAPLRFRALPLPDVLRAIETVYEVHLLLAAQGYVAVDFYDGCMIYDFEARRMYVCDLDMVHEGPYELAMDRNYGSSRFMAPEEFQRGATIDQTSNVYTLGRTALLLLGDGRGSWEAFRGPCAMRRVIERATRHARAERYLTVQAFVEAWRAVAAP